MLIDNSSTNEHVVSALREAGVSAPVLLQYTNEMPSTQDNLETLSSYWVQRITSHHLYNKQMIDVCLFLRDTSSKVLWVDCFKNHVVPILMTYNIVE